MVNVPERDKREIIARAPFVDEMVGEMVAHLLHGNAHIDVEIKPFETDMYAKVGLNLKEVRRTALELLRMAEVAQQATWTPRLLANVRERYLPGATDAQIIEQLRRLAERDDGLELLESGLLFPQDGYALTAEAHRELVDRIAAALSAAGVTLGELESSVDDLRKVYASRAADVS
ncbi:hypothetical protein [Jiangella alkaliphila]|uniref:Uncharacterized protein n=1 Tax=Jiangella alkaliphila TaxID=419479 RepID=A0A1H2LPD9_9ACTN|nr:hypothetical protein [Jiangella alkaliphila]SDU82615.1 hypothetical protein SAMN04488563_6443 [Jiangella alkaliphila]